MAGHDDLIATIADLPTISPAPDFGLQVLQELVQVQRQSNRRQRLVRLTMALAAGLLFALVSWQNLNLFHADSIPKIANHPALGTIAFETHYLQLAEDHAEPWPETSLAPKWNWQAKWPKVLSRSRDRSTAPCITCGARCRAATWLKRCFNGSSQPGLRIPNIAEFRSHRS